MTPLDQYGWLRYSHACTSIEIPQDLTLGRIASIKGFKYYTWTEQGELECDLSGRLLYLPPPDHPKIGDWVTLMVYDTTGYIIGVLPRYNALSRRNPGTTAERQLLAANVDAALVVQGLDRDFNIMRLERYLVQLAACNVPALVVLNKADLVDDTQPYIDAVQNLGRQVPALCCSTRTGMGMRALQEELLQPGHTYVLIGSSGVGKSSLLNALLDDTQQATGTTSDSNQKGRHTTTTRDLFRLPNDSLLIDTPGMREFGVTGSGETPSEDLFPVIQTLAIDCRFTDCRHLDEQGCAVLAALHDGTLPDAVYYSYLKLKKEMRRFEIDVSDKKRLNKQFGKITREVKNHRKRFKY
jgi:ribosome biogenesis GTPase